MAIEEIDFENDSFEDIVEKDKRYAPRAYALLMDVVRFLSEDGKPFDAEDIMDEFRERTLDQYGPMSYTVLTEWGVTKCEDLGEMMFNLADAKRVARSENDTQESFIGGYDFKEAFLGPYAV
jgi:uncharacterized repeat protein (TIGR04138 family)